MLGYLEQLTLRLSKGVEQLGADVRARHGGYLLAAQRDDGGFAGREGSSDLYYTGFALRSLAILGLLEGPVAERAAGFLRSRLVGHAPAIDVFSLIYSAALVESADGRDVFAECNPRWREALDATLEALRRPDGGYAKTDEGAAGSVYHSFLVLLCRQLLGSAQPEPQRLVDFVLGHCRDDGGFVEMTMMKRSGTNPTAAAIAALAILDALDQPTREGAVDFLAEMQTDEGGLRANTRIPVADLLSTFTGLLTLADLNAADEISLPGVARYVRSLERPEGGFHGAVLDEGADVEYTFYGLGCLGLLRGQ
jgi:geranylgeranyl transferase type-2 subunit beta